MKVFLQLFSVSRGEIEIKKQKQTMEKQIEMLVTKKLEQFYCSILLDEVKEKVRKLKAYGVDEAEIMAAMNEE